MERAPLSTRTMLTLRLLSIAVITSSAIAFAPSSFINHGGVSAIGPSNLKMMDPSMIDVASLSGFVDSASQMMQQSSSALASGEMFSDLTSQPSNLLAFSDQGQNLAGIFFQASLLPYLLFLYFLSFRGNRISDIGNFGFQFVLLFVLSTIPSGIISKSTYGTSLADCDWLHGGAELLLTVANIMIVGSLWNSSILEMLVQDLILSCFFDRFWDSKKLLQTQILQRLV